MTSTTEESTVEQDLAESEKRMGESLQGLGVAILFLLGVAAIGSVVVMFR